MSCHTIIHCIKDVFHFQMSYGFTLSVIFVPMLGASWNQRGNTVSASCLLELHIATLSFLLCTIVLP